ncbi:MAG: YkgJ family cysteine cluster protein [Candidatus Bathyarchaeota archaeon]|nr:MAG: YkgJ family cysteine cluster protein [Candidatus Bathyarchaeota archaeon]
MSFINFKCKKCGSCCHNLLEEVANVERGLFLRVEEAKLFPRNLVSPRMALGDSKPKRIIAYQLNVDECPFITEKNECKVYPKRPMGCRMFPFEIHHNGHATVSVKCSVIGSQMGDKESREIEFSSTEKEAIEEYMRFLNSLQKFARPSQKVWEFNLKTKSWFTA